MRRRHRAFGHVAAAAVLAFVTGIAFAQMPAQTPARPSYWQSGWTMHPTPRRGPNDGGGPYDKLVIWGATVIDGTGSPPYGPVNIVVEGNRIVDIDRASLDKAPAGARVIDARGQYVTPGFIDVHDHVGEAKIGFDPSYTYKLWLGHGITTVKGVPFGNLGWSLKQKELSEKNEIVAPRLVVCSGWLGHDSDHKITTPEQAREWVRKLKKMGVDCLGELFTMYPDIEAAVLDEGEKQHMETQSHLSQNHVSQMNAAEAVKLGLDEVTHFYGIMESMLDKHTIQDWPLDYNYNNEYDRFSKVAQLWNQSARPGSKKWRDLIDLFIKHDTILSPTMTIYLASRDPMAARNANWMSDYVLPSLWQFFEPNPKSHGSYFYHWTSADEADWHHFYVKWQKFLKDYNDAGGRITVGEDTSFIYQVAGFGYIQELKLLQEAGLTPFEILRSATLYGAESIFMPRKPWGKPVEYGVVREGMKADLLVFSRNPLEDFNMLYGTGALRLDEKTGKVHRVHALKYTIKDGVVYDSQKLLAEVREMVGEAKQQHPDVKTPFIPLAEPE